VKPKILMLCALALGAGSARAQSSAAPTKVGIIHIQNAIISTKDGQKAAQELEQKGGPKRKELEKKQSDIASLQDQLRKTSNTASEDSKQKLMRDIDAKTKSYNRDLEDAQAEWDQEQQKVLQDLGGRIMAVIDKYATDNGYAVILDVSSQQTPVLYAANSVDITREIIALYDKNAPAAAQPAKPGLTPPAPAPVPKPMAPPPAAAPKKQPGAPK
jgi:outer membrane protein